MLHLDPLLLELSHLFFVLLDGVLKSLNSGKKVVHLALLLLGTFFNHGSKSLLASAKLLNHVLELAQCLLLALLALNVLISLLAPELVQATVIHGTLMDLGRAELVSVLADDAVERVGRQVLELRAHRVQIHEVVAIWVRLKVITALMEV